MTHLSTRTRLFRPLLYNNSSWTCYDIMYTFRSWLVTCSRALCAYEPCQEHAPTPDQHIGAAKQWIKYKHDIID